jgi:diguanylate cyclase (GGDEF)-like protein
LRCLVLPFFRNLYIFSVRAIAGLLASLLFASTCLAQQRVTDSQITELQSKYFTDQHQTFPAIVSLVQRLVPDDPASLQLRAWILFAASLSANGFSDHAQKFLPQAIELARLTGNSMAQAHLKLLQFCNQTYLNANAPIHEPIRALVSTLKQDTDKAQYATTILAVAGTTSDSRLADLTVELIEPLKTLFRDNEKLADIEPDYWQIHALVLEQIDDLDGAIGALNKALGYVDGKKIRGNSDVYQYYLGDIYARKGDWKNSQANFRLAYERCKELNKLNGLTWAAMRLAVSHLNRKTNVDDMKSLEWAKIAMPLMPLLDEPNGVIELQLTMAELARRSKDFATSKFYFEQVKAKYEILRGRNVKSFHLLGSLLAVEQNDYKQAFEQIRLLNERSELQAASATQRKMIGLRSLLAHSEQERALQLKLAQDEKAAQQHEREKLQSTVAVLGAILLVFISACAFYLYQRSARYRELAEIDDLTGVSSRRAIIAHCKKEIATAKRIQTDFSVAVFDLDHFKQLNDRSGHAGGDAVLVRLAQAVSASLGTQCQLGRLGGDEFSVAMATTHYEQSCEMAQQIGQIVRQLALPDGLEWRATVSIGVATLHEGEDYDSLYARADKALYAAKAAGRDQFIHAQSLSDLNLRGPGTGRRRTDLRLPKEANQLA